MFPRNPWFSTCCPRGPRLRSLASFDGPGAVDNVPRILNTGSGPLAPKPLQCQNKEDRARAASQHGTGETNKQNDQAEIVIDFLWAIFHQPLYNCTIPLWWLIVRIRRDYCIVLACLSMMCQTAVCIYLSVYLFIYLFINFLYLHNYNNI